MNTAQINPIEDPRFLNFMNLCENDNKKYFDKVKEYDHSSMKAALANSSMKFIECDNCKSTENTKLCSRCQEVRYCSTACQKAAWQIHKKVCQRQTFESLVLMKEVPSWIADCVKPFYIQIENIEQIFKDKDASPYMYDKISKKRTIVFLSNFCNLTGHKLPYGIPIKLIPLTLEAK
ncbi:MAG: zinc finger MYND domain-containing protein [Candidatus Protochlamydia sp.]|nr:zinc finger MYND domain-containing protein [Candidatus Protochlamydia sp.]